MTFDVDLHRTTITLRDRLANGKPFEMSVIDAGPEQGDKFEAPTIVFIHGFGGRAAYWEYQLEQFHESYRVLALDLRGHGYTDAPTEADGARYDVPELVGDIEAALEALRVPQRFILVCHSFGGALASCFVNRHPQRVTALVIIASAVRFQLRLAGRLLLRVPPALLTWMREVLPYFGFNAAKVYPPAHVVYLQNRNGLAVWDGAELLRAIKIPSMVILGQRDTLFSDASYKEVARLIPAAEEVVIPVSAHQVMVERPDAVNRAIVRFLQAQSDPLQVAQEKAAQKAERRAARKALEAERPWLKFYDSRTPYRIKPPTVPLPRLLEATARRFGKTAALDYLGGRMTWHELDREANRFANGLQTLHVQPGERVLLTMPNIPQWVIAYFGVQKAGAVAVLADPGSAAELLLTRVAATGSVVLVTTTDRYRELRDLLRDDARATGLRRVVFASQMDYLGWPDKIKFGLLRNVQEGHWLPWFRRDARNKKTERRFLHFKQVLARGHAFAPDVAQSVEATAAIVYTFGTGGAPMPVPLSHRNLAANALQLRHWLPESRPGDERFLAQQVFSSAYGLSGLLHLAVYLGATLILLPSADLPLLLRTVRKTRPTYFPTTPRMVRLLTHTAGVRRYGLASIRVCAVSGSPLAQEIREEFEKITRGRLIEAYGLTEAAPAALAMPVAARRQIGSVGLPLPDTEARIVDLDSGVDAPPEVMGELWLRGPQVFSGYDGGDPRGTSLSASRLQNGWLATGDIASMDEDGFFTVVDRKENMVVRDGQRIFPRQIEEVLFEHPSVSMAWVRREQDGTGRIHLRAHVLLHRNMSVAVEELLKYCAKRLHASAVPDSICLEPQESGNPD
ncbi:MAG: alpha/beta fold hydrolase [Burkholderiaceae bacterium]|nr:alpha/beta fold hydrolase [Burkholderiaceae bacterium]